jgi:transposase
MSTFSDWPNCPPPVTMLKAYSDDLKACIPILIDSSMSPEETCHVLGVKCTLVYTTLKLHSEYGLPYCPDCARRGRHHILSHTDVRFINSLLEHDHTLYLDEIRDWLTMECNIYVSISTIKRTLNRLCLSHKGTSSAAKERNELLHTAFLLRMAEVMMNPDMLLCTDESSKDDRMVAQCWGYSRIGVWCSTYGPFVRGKWYLILPLLSINGYIAHDIVEGSVIAEIFEAFLCEQVVRIVLWLPCHLLISKLLGSPNVAISWAL